MKYFDEIRPSEGYPDQSLVKKYKNESRYQEVDLTLGSISCCLKNKSSLDEINSVFFHPEL
jgi:hypothetical protein